MPNNEEEFSNSPGFLRYKIEQLEKLVYPLIESVNSLDKKLSLLAQKMLIATAFIGVAFQAFGVWYSSNGNQSIDKYSEQEKITYYETRIKDSEKIKALEAELASLKTKK